MYLSVKHYQILQPLSREEDSIKRTSILGSRRVGGIKRSVGSIIRKSGRESMLLPDNNSSIKSPRRESFSSNTSSTSTRCGSPTTSTNTMIQYMNSHASSLFSSEPPYYKEGVVMRKHLLENATQKARHREWRECLLEVNGEGELRMYALADKRHSSATLDVFNPRVSKQIHSFNGASNQWAVINNYIMNMNIPIFIHFYISHIHSYWVRLH